MNKNNQISYSIESFKFGRIGFISLPVMMGIPLSLYKPNKIGLKPIRFGTHSIKPHSSFKGTTV